MASEFVLKNDKSVYDGSWTEFTGDQIGTMLGHWLYTQIGKQSEKVKNVV